MRAARVRVPVRGRSPGFRDWDAPGAQLLRCGALASGYRRADCRPVHPLDVQRPDVSPRLEAASSVRPMTTTASLPIVPLIDPRDDAPYGGKAVNLARLMRSGAPVPEGVVVTNGEIDREGGDAEAVWARLGFSTAIVRSSAVGEDSSDASFAGQLDSV